MITIGCDPEVFLQDKNGKFISSINLIGGSKDRPKDYGDGIFLQEDNVAVEWNIQPSVECTDFIRQNRLAMNKIRNLVKEKGLFMSITASANFASDQLEDPKAKEFGCEPDFNAWTLKMNPRPKTKDQSLRVAGGHVHIGYQDDGILRQQIVRAMDLLCAVPMTFVDKDILRRNLYGKAGAFRPKEYGLEYRTLSNYWLTSDSLMDFVFRSSQNAVELCKDKSFNNLVNGNQVNIIRAINTNDRNAAITLMMEFDEFIIPNEEIEAIAHAV